LDLDVSSLLDSESLVLTFVDDNVKVVRLDGLEPENWVRLIILNTIWSVTLLNVCLHVPKAKFTMFRP